MNVERAGELFLQLRPFLDGQAVEADDFGALDAGARFQKPPLDLEMQRACVLARSARIDATPPRSRAGRRQ